MVGPLWNLSQIWHFTLSCPDTFNGVHYLCLGGGGVTPAMWVISFYMLKRETPISSAPPPGINIVQFLIWYAPQSILNRFISRISSSKIDTKSLSINKTTQLAWC